MLFLTTTKWNVWFLQGVREQEKQADYEPSGLPVTREEGTVAIATELGHGEFAAGILIKGAVTAEMEKADSVLTFLLLGGGREGPQVNWEARKQQRADSGREWEVKASGMLRSRRKEQRQHSSETYLGKVM